MWKDSKYIIPQTFTIKFDNKKDASLVRQNICHNGKIWLASLVHFTGYASIRENDFHPQIVQSRVGRMVDNPKLTQFLNETDPSFGNIQRLIINQSFDLDNNTTIQQARKHYNEKFKEEYSKMFFAHDADSGIMKDIFERMMLDKAYHSELFNSLNLGTAYAITAQNCTGCVWKFETNTTVPPIHKMIRIIERFPHIRMEMNSVEYVEGRFAMQLVSDGNGMIHLLRADTFTDEICEITARTLSADRSEIRACPMMPSGCVDKYVYDNKYALAKIQYNLPSFDQLGTLPDKSTWTIAETSQDSEHYSLENLNALEESLVTYFK